MLAVPCASGPPNACQRGYRHRGGPAATLVPLCWFISSPEPSRLAAGGSECRVISISKTSAIEKLIDALRGICPASKSPGALVACRGPPLQSSHHDTRFICAFSVGGRIRPVTSALSGPVHSTSCLLPCTWFGFTRRQPQRSLNGRLVSKSKTAWMTHCDIGQQYIPL